MFNYISNEQRGTSLVLDTGVTKEQKKDNAPKTKKKAKTVTLVILKTKIFQLSFHGLVCHCNVMWWVGWTQRA